MDKIQLLYVENIIIRNHEKVQQRLTFFMQVENIGHTKEIDVIWAGEDGIWLTLAAKYSGMLGDDKEYWQATVTCTLSENNSLPGNIEFGIRYRVSGVEFWDNKKGSNYLSEADSGIQLANRKIIQNIGFTGEWVNEQQNIPLTIAVDQNHRFDKVTIHWSSDGWETTHQSSCQTSKHFWDRNYRSNARNPNQYASQLWAGEISSDNPFKVQYAICCERNGNTIWDNNDGNNYFFQQTQLKVLILNLHCYQEENQDEKFTLIAKVINELKIDIICFQEVAEYWRDGEGDWESNSAKLINDRLTKRFNLHTDWSHLGFDKYKEGVAILSRFPLSDHQSRYVSDSHDIYSIHSRKVVMAKVHVPFLGAINVFSAHLSWLEDGFEQQFNQLHAWAEDNQSNDVKTSLLCGDFNITAGSSGYEMVVDSNKYDDQFLAANKRGIFDKIFRVNDAHWQDLLADDYRIDYIFMNKPGELEVTSAEFIFTEQDYGRVSDHCGYLLTFEPKSKDAKASENGNS
jgi:maltose 6'-phosphate phosphatase